MYEMAIKMFSAKEGSPGYDEAWHKAYDEHCEVQFRAAAECDRIWKAKMAGENDRNKLELVATVVNASDWEDKDSVMKEEQQLGASDNIANEIAWEDSVVDSGMEEQLQVVDDSAHEFASDQTLWDENVVSGMEEHVQVMDDSFWNLTSEPMEEDYQMVLVDKEPAASAIVATETGAELAQSDATNARRRSFLRRFSRHRSG